MVNSIAFRLRRSHCAAVASSGAPDGLVFGQCVHWSLRAQSGLVSAKSEAFAAPRAIAMIIAGSASIVFCSAMREKSGIFAQAGSERYLSFSPAFSKFAFAEPQ